MAEPIDRSNKKTEKTTTLKQYMTRVTYLTNEAANQVTSHGRARCQHVLCLVTLCCGQVISPKQSKKHMIFNLYNLFYTPGTWKDHFFLVVLKTTIFFVVSKKYGRFILQSFYT